MSLLRSFENFLSHMKAVAAAAAVVDDDDDDDDDGDINKERSAAT